MKRTKVMVKAHSSHRRSRPVGSEPTSPARLAFAAKLVMPGV